MLIIQDLTISTENKTIITGLNLEIKAGEVHVIMGPNGAGKSTLAQVLAGHPKCQIEHGSIEYLDKDLTKMLPEERAQQGVFLAWQNPVEIPGITISELLRESTNAISEKQTHLSEINEDIKNKAPKCMLNDEVLSRSLNVDFSGGEKKRSEILQMQILKPRLKILDETDSGLDLDCLRCLATNINELQTNDTATIIITHNPRMLEFIDQIDKVHVMVKGKLVETGDRDLIDTIEKSGFQTYESK